MSSNAPVFVYMRDARTVRRGAELTRSCSWPYSTRLWGWREGHGTVLEMQEAVISGPLACTSQDAWSVCPALRRLARYQMRITRKWGGCLRRTRFFEVYFGGVNVE